MSAMPECTRCGNFVHSGPVVCEKCLNFVMNEIEHVMKLAGIKHFHAKIIVAIMRRAFSINKKGGINEEGS